MTNPKLLPLRQPLIGCALLWLAGTAIGLMQTCHARHFIMAGFLLACMAGVCALRVKSRTSALALTALALFLAGMASGATASATTVAEHQWLAANEKRPLEIYGTVDRMVGIKPPGRRRNHPVVPLRNVMLRGDGFQQPLRHTMVWVTWYGAEQPPAVGEKWSFHTKLARLDSGSYSKFLPVNSRAANARRLRPPSFWDWRPLADKTRDTAARRLSLGIEQWPVVPALIQAMLLGTRSAVPYEINAVFRASGTIHVFAISGLGIGIVASIMAACLSLIGVPRHRWGIPLIPMLTAYTLLTGASPSAMRACLMAAVYFGAPLLGRKADGATTLSAAAMAQIACNPPDLFNLSFILSYAAMAGLVILYQPFAYLCKRWLRVAPAARRAALERLAGRLSGRATVQGATVNGARLAAVRQNIRRYIAELLAVGFAAWLASVPLTAYYFGRFIPGGLLANLVVVPSALLISVSGALALAFSFISEFFAATFNNSAAFFTHMMVMASRATIAVPWATMTVPPPSPAVVAIWYGALFWFAHRVRQAQAREAQQETEPF